MDVHSHLCKTEVIGLLGGVYNSTRNIVTVVRAEPCSSTSTSLHCDMDPGSGGCPSFLFQHLLLFNCQLIMTRLPLKYDSSLCSSISDGGWRDHQALRATGGRVVPFPPYLCAQPISAR